MGEKTQLGVFIRECRNGLKYTSREIARLSNGRTDIPSISNSYLISVENGKHIPRLDKIIALADLLNVPVTHFVDRCREDIGTRPGPPEGVEVSDLMQAAAEHVEMNDYAQALVQYRQAMAYVSKVGAEAFDATVLRKLKLDIAKCYRGLKITRVAKEEIESLLRDKALDDRTRAEASFELARIYKDEQNTFLGVLVAKEGLELARRAGDETLQAKVLCTLGDLAMDDGRLDEALTIYRESAVGMKKLGQRRAALKIRIHQGLLLVEKREFFKAIDLLRTELTECRDNDPYVRGSLHIGLAKAYFGAENYKSSRTHARSARDCAVKLEDPSLQFLSVFYLWRAAVREGAEDSAKMHLETLKYHRNRLDAAFGEVEQFDRMRKATDRRGQVSEGAA